LCYSGNFSFSPIVSFQTDRVNLASGLLKLLAICIPHRSSNDPFPIPIPFSRLWPVFSHSFLTPGKELFYGGPRQPKTENFLLIICFPSHFFCPPSRTLFFEYLVQYINGLPMRFFLINLQGLNSSNNATRISFFSLTRISGFFSLTFLS